MTRDTRAWERVKSELATIGRRPRLGERADADLIAEAIAGALELHEPVVDAPEPAVSRHWTASMLAVVLATAALATAAAAAWVFAVHPVLRSRDAGETSRSLALDRASTRRDGAIGIDPVPEPVHPPARRPVRNDAESPPAGDPSATAPLSTPPAPESSRPRAVAIPTAGTLLRRAQQRLRDGQLREAERTYVGLVEHFPSSAEADVALVTLGRLALRRRDPVAALRRYDRYLQRSAGVLREEARYGRIQAVRALGRSSQEAAAITAFLADHPDSLYAGRLRTRLRALESDR